MANQLSKLIIPFCVLFLLQGCAHNGLSRAEAERLRQQIKPVLCEGEDDCGRKWERAVGWLIQNAPTSLQMQTDKVASTSNCASDSCTETSFTINLVPLRGGKSQIAFRSLGCRNMFACYPEPLQAQLDFIKYVSHDPYQEAAAKRARREALLREQAERDAQGQTSPTNDAEAGDTQKVNP